MGKKFNVKEFSKKKKLAEYVYENIDKIEVVYVSTSQVSVEYKHFLWHFKRILKMLTPKMLYKKASDCY